MLRVEVIFTLVSERVGGGKEVRGVIGDPSTTQSQDHPSPSRSSSLPTPRSTSPTKLCTGFGAVDGLLDCIPLPTLHTPHPTALAHLPCAASPEQSLGRWIRIVCRTHVPQSCSGLSEPNGPCARRARRAADGASCCCCCFGGGGGGGGGV
eukprot:275856-Chlamydomonas_euryale.AAC.1